MIGKSTLAHLRGVTTLGLMLCTFSTANATLIGDTVSCTGIFSFSCSSPTAVVGGGVEFLVSHPTPIEFSVDIGASSIVVTSTIADNLATTWNITLSDLAWVGMPLAEIVGITNFVTTANFGIDTSDITFGAHSVFIDLDLSGWSADQFLSFDLVTNHQLPEPTTLSLLAIGLASGFFLRRRRTA